MISYLFDIGFIGVVSVSTFLLVRKSLLESVTALIAIILSALISLNCFEPAANFISKTMFAENDYWAHYCVWFLTVIGIFTWLSALVWIAFQKVLDQATLELGRWDSTCRWFCSGLGGYILGAFLLTTLHTLPAPRDFWGGFPPELQRRTSPVMAAGPDYQLLTVAEYICRPRAALSGSPWSPSGPLMQPSLDADRWSSFPIRYALWREDMERARAEYYLTADYTTDSEPNPGLL